MFSSTVIKRGIHISPVSCDQRINRHPSARISITGWGGFCLAAFLLLMVQTPLAQDAVPEDVIPEMQKKDPVTANVIVGIDPDYPYRRDLSWVPITVELTNNAKALKGDLVIRLKDGSVTYKTPIDLPSRSTKPYEAYVLFTGLQDEVEFYIESGRNSFQVALITISTTFQHDNRFVTVISPERGTHSILAHRPEDEDSDRFRRVVYTTPAHLPRYSIGYENFDVLIWDGGPSTAITSSQSVALEKWIQMGGTLVLAAGERWQELNDSPFRLFVPMTLSGSKVLEPDTALTSQSSNIQPKLETSAVIATGELLDDPKIDVLLSAGIDPFLIERKWGAGRIVFVASSVKEKLFANDIYQVIFQDFISQSPLTFNPEVIDHLDTGISGFLLWMVQAELPSTWFIAIYLGCYIIIVVPINYLVFRAIGRLEWAWFTVPIWALIFAYGAYYIGALRQQGNVTVNQISIVEARPGASTGMAITYSSIYSPVRQWYTLLFDDPAAFPSLPANNPRGNESSRDERLTVNYSDTGSSVEDFLIYHWSSRLIKAQHETSLGDGIDVDLKWQDDLITGTIANHTGNTLYDLSIFLNQHIIHPQTILKDGDSIEIDQDISSTTTFNCENIFWDAMNLQSYNEFQRNPTLFIQNFLKKSYASAQLTKHPAMGIAVLTARLDKHVLDFHLDRGTINPHGETLVGVTFPLRKKIQGRLILSRNSWRFGQGDLITQGIGQMGNLGGYAMAQQRNRLNDTQIMVPHNSEHVWDITSNEPLEGGNIESLTFDLNYRRLQYQLRRSGRQELPFSMADGKPSDPQYELHVRNQFTSQFVPLSSIIGDNNEVQNPGRYVNKLTGVITVRLKSPTDHETIVPKDAFNIEMMINFGTESSGKFLGRMVDAVSENM